MLRRMMTALVLVPVLACASGGSRRPVAGAALPPGVRMSEVCGDGNPMPRLRVYGRDAHGRALPDAAVEIRDGSRVVTDGRADEDGATLFALEARPYTVAWERRGFVSPPPFPVRAKRGCELQVVIQAEPVG